MGFNFDFGSFVLGTLAILVIEIAWVGIASTYNPAFSKTDIAKCAQHREWCAVQHPDLLKAITAPAGDENE